MIEIVPATTAEHFPQFQELVDELMAWDSVMSREIGLNLDTLQDFFNKKPQLPSRPNSRRTVTSS